MDKSWVNDLNRFSSSYVTGVQLFINFAKENITGSDNVIRCPCVVCNNMYSKNTVEVQHHIILNGFSPSYKEWIFHGEKMPDSVNKKDDVGDKTNGNDNNLDLGDGLSEMLSEMREARESTGRSDENTTSFSKLLNDAHCDLYPGCKISLLSTVVKLLHLKVLGKWSNKSFTMLLEFLKEILPEGDTLPSSLYGARKMLIEIGLGYEVIHVCKNDCSLFWKENSKEENCPVCKESRWQIGTAKGKRVPHKKLRYFPIKPRLQRLFMFSKTASKMRWHKNQRVEEDGIARHPADSLAWKHFDKTFPDFAKDPRNIRLGLASDGFTPWSNMGNSHSMWPVILTVYNLPPYDCMRAPFLLMSLLIPGPNYPGKNFDVFLRPVVDELKEFWSPGVDTYDVIKKEIFKLRAAVLWTISDFPGNKLLSGWSTAGCLACPCCMAETDFKKLRTKVCYMGHHRFLPKKHVFRKNSKDFNGEEEHRDQPNQLSGEEILQWLKSLEAVFDKSAKHSRKRKRGSDQANWDKKSIFYELTYWPMLLIRHCLDVMHIEKNICDNILATLLDIFGRTKDPAIAREDLRDWGIREELHLQKRPKDNKLIKPPACFTLSTSEKDEFHEFLRSVKYPDGFGANISTVVKDNKLTSLKTHDCHILLQRLIPAGIRGFLTPEVNEVLQELGDYFKELCCKTLKDDDVERLDKNIPIILCKLEKIFPPYFFTVMVHLSVHLAKEAKIAGPVQFRWMYPIERFLGSLKGFVRNKAHPEGSIAEGYVVSECLTFLSMYLPGVETRLNRPERNPDGDHGNQNERISVFSMRTRPFGRIKSNQPSLSEEELQDAHWNILINCDEVEPFRKIYKAEMEGISVDEVTDFNGHDQRQKKEFPTWFKEHINSLNAEKPNEVTDDLWSLANGPLRLDTCSYNGCIVNKVRFHTRGRDSQRRTQNSGLVVESNHKDQIIEFFGFLERVVEINYIGGSKVVLFKCEWFDMGSKKTVQRDKHFISVDVKSRWYKEDPFILPVHVQQVFYIKDTKLGGNWQIVQRIQHRHLWDLPELDEDNGTDEMNVDSTTEFIQQYESGGVTLVSETGNQSHILSRNDVQPAEVDSLYHESKKSKHKGSKGVGGTKIGTIEALEDDILEQTEKVGTLQDDEEKDEEPRKFAGSSSNHREKVVLMDDYLRAVSRTLILQLRQHDNTLIGEGMKSHGMRQRDLIQCYIMEQNENNAYESMDEAASEVTKVKSIIELLLQEGSLIIIDDGGQEVNEKYAKPLRNDRILSVAPNYVLD